MHLTKISVEYSLYDRQVSTPTISYKPFHAATATFTKLSLEIDNPSNQVIGGNCLSRIQQQTATFTLFHCILTLFYIIGKFEF